MDGKLKPNDDEVGGDDDDDDCLRGEKTSGPDG